jgi:Gas vesicle synthesis protein GvpL/GvpF
VIHIYAIACQLEELPPVPGLGEAALERARVEGLDVIMSRIDGEGIEPTDEAVVRHAEVVEALQSRSDVVLPARFGHVFPDEEHLVTAVKSKRAELERGLDRVRGCVEFGVRVVFHEERSVAESPIRSGREYMGRRLEQATRRRMLAAQIDEPLSRFARAATRVDGSPPDILLTAAYLVPETAAEAFRLEVQGLQDRFADLDVLCTGPWPPYSFAAETDA